MDESKKVAVAGIEPGLPTTWIDEIGYCNALDGVCIVNLRQARFADTSNGNCEVSLSTVASLRFTPRVAKALQEVLGRLIAASEPVTGSVN